MKVKNRLQATPFRPLAALAALILALAGTAADARAAAIISSQGGPRTDAGIVYQNFESLTVSSAGGTLGPAGNTMTVSFTPDGATVVGASSGQYARPFINNKSGELFGDNTVNGYDETKYLSTGLGTVSLAFSTGQNYLGLLWGSVDTYNKLVFYNGNTEVGSITGVQALAPANGYQESGGSAYVNILTDSLFNRVVAYTNNNAGNTAQYAFEFDNVAYGVVPEPASLAMCGTALLTVGGVVLRRRRKAQAVEA